jgi:hypothetical protein
MGISVFLWELMGLAKAGVAIRITSRITKIAIRPFFVFDMFATRFLLAHAMGLHFMCQNDQAYLNINLTSCYYLIID